MINWRFYLLSTFRLGRLINVWNVNWDSGFEATLLLSGGSTFSFQNAPNFPDKLLAGLPGWNYTVGESPGVRVTQIYWPCLLTPRPGSSPHIATFKLHFWDAGDSAVRRSCNEEFLGAQNEIRKAKNRET